MSRPPTIRDVAATAGVSFKTVSRVMNGEPHVRESLRERVLAAARKIDYTANRSARRLVGARSHLIGFLYDNPNFDYIANAEAGIVRQCQSMGYHIVIESVDASRDVGDQFDGILSSLRLDGVVLTSPLSESADAIAALRRANTPFVCVGPLCALADISVVCIDDETAAEAVTRHLIELGHRDIGFIGGHVNHGASSRRLAGFRAAMSTIGVDVAASRLASGDFTFDSGRGGAATLLSCGDRPPTAIFAANDQMALGAMSMARDHGLVLPHDLSIVGFDDSRSGMMSWPPLTTVRQPVDLMCESATAILIDHIEQGSSPATAMRLDFEIVIRDSTAPPGRP